MTGAEASRQAVLQLSNWVEFAYEGSGTLFGLLVALKNSGRIENKSIFTGRYPLDRGIGYYINALLDKFYLTRDLSVIDQVEHIIQHTVHPRDDITQRNLEDAENRWFYTVFFQYLCRYLAIKEEMNALDSSFYYARDTLLHYANWMSEQEYPYLEKPEIFEFPNHIWTAQDIRKLYVLNHAAHHTPENKTKFLAKAREIYQYIVKNLTDEPTRTYSPGNPDAESRRSSGPGKLT